MVRAPWLVLLCAAPIACGSSPSSTLDGAPAHDSPVTHDSPAAHDSPPVTDVPAGTCSGSGFAGGETTTAGATITATLVDQNGSAFAGQPVFLCGTNICAPAAQTDGSGHVTLTTALSMTRASARFGDALTAAELAIQLTQSTTSFGTITTARFPTAGSALAPGTTAVSGDVSIALAGSATVAIDELVYTTPDQQALRTAAIPIASTTALFAPVQVAGHAADFSLLYGLAPAETLVCPPAQVTVALPHAHTSPNDLGWAAGAAVELWITSVDSGQVYAPDGGWAKASDGVVSADGTKVTTVAGQGLPVLDTFAVRLAQ